MSELYRYQNAWCNNKKKIMHHSISTRRFYWYRLSFILIHATNIGPSTYFVTRPTDPYGVFSVSRNPWVYLMSYTTSRGPDWGPMW